MDKLAEAFFYLVLFLLIGLAGLVFGVLVFAIQASS